MTFEKGRWVEAPPGDKIFKAMGFGCKEAKHGKVCGCTDFYINEIRQGTAPGLFHIFLTCKNCNNKTVILIGVNQNTVDPLLQVVEFK